MISDRLPFSSMLVLWRIISYGRVSVGIAYIEQEEDHGTLTVLDGVSYSSFMHLYIIILSHIMNPTVISLQPGFLRSLGVYRCPLCSLRCHAVNTIRSTSLSSRLLALLSGEGISTYSTTTNSTGETVNNYISLFLVCRAIPIVGVGNKRRILTGHGDLPTCRGSTGWEIL